MTPKNLAIRPSSNHRLLSCAGSAWVATATRGFQRTSEYAAEGTMAHAWLAGCLTGARPETYLKPDDEVIVLPDDDINLIKSMAELIKDMAELDGCELYVEQPVGMKLGEHDMLGTIDVLMVSKERLIVLDYKHGAGRRVEVKHNAQLSTYALMADHLYPGREIEFGVIQPRGVGDGLATWLPGPEYMADFHDNLSAAIARAYSADPGYNEGPWCWGCGGEDLGACPLKLEKALEYAVKGEGFDTDAAVTPSWWLLDVAQSAAKTAKKVREYAVAELKSGREVPGWALSDELGNRRWREPEDIPNVLAELTGLEASDFMKVSAPKPITITDSKSHPALKGIDLQKYMERPLKKVLTKQQVDQATLFGEVE